MDEGVVIEIHNRYILYTPVLMTSCTDSTPVQSLVHANSNYEELKNEIERTESEL